MVMSLSSPRKRFPFSIVSLACNQRIGGGRGFLVNFITNIFLFLFAQTSMNVRSIMAAAAIIVTISLDHFIVVVQTEPVWVPTI